ncbi:MAG: c-type cytochrome [Acidiferrobacteraceae bacterium]
MALGITTGLILLSINTVTVAAKAVPAIVASTCSACHGADGVSLDPAFPNLAAQGLPYLVREIRDFQNHRRADPLARSIMWPMATYVPQNEIHEIADYFADQKVAPGVKENPKLVAAGRKIYTSGVASSHIAACAACHGPTGRGIPPLFPELAGQQMMYTVTQLQYFKAKERMGPLGMMNTMATQLSKKQMAEVAAFIRTL